MKTLIVFALLGLLAYLFLKKPPPKKGHKARVEIRKSGGRQENDRDTFFNGSEVESIPAVGNYRITYRDRNGDTSKRDITVKSAIRNERGRMAIEAHCHLRSSHRTFIEDRIREAVNLDTGEVVRSLTADAIRQHEISPQGIINAAIKEEGAGVSILLYIARADGRMVKSEREVVIDFILSRCPHLAKFRGELDETVRFLRQTEKAEFKSIIDNLREQGRIQHLKSLLTFGEQIVAKKKNVADGEVEAIHYLKNAAT